MKYCVCGDRALYFCKSHQAAVCNKHKPMHEEGKEREHIYEEFGQMLTTQRRAKIVDSLLSKDKIADQCADRIRKKSNWAVETIRDSCMEALDLVNKKKRYYADLLSICHRRIFDDEINEFQIISKNITCGKYA